MQIESLLYEQRILVRTELFGSIVSKNIDARVVRTGGARAIGVGGVGPKARSFGDYTPKKFVVNDLSRDFDAEGGAFVQLGVGDVDFAFVVLGDDTLGKRKAQTPATLLGGVTGIKDTLP